MIVEQNNFLFLSVYRLVESRFDIRQEQVSALISVAHLPVVEWKMTPLQFALYKRCTITNRFKDDILKLQLRVGHSDAGIAGRNVRVRHAIMEHRDLGQFCFLDDGDCLPAGFLRASNYIVLRGTRSKLHKNEPCVFASKFYVIFIFFLITVLGVEIQSSGQTYGVSYFHHQNGEIDFR